MGVSLEHFLEGSAPLRFGKITQRRFVFVSLPLWVNVQSKDLLHEETLFMTRQRSAIEEVNDCALEK